MSTETTKTDRKRRDNNKNNGRKRADNSQKDNSRNDKIKKEKLKTIKKGTLHPRNLHQGRYDLEALCSTLPELKLYLKPNPLGDNTIDFTNPKAVRSLNKALLLHYYKIDSWEIPEGYLCPPIPGRADYIHYLADLLSNGGTSPIPKGKEVKVLDIGCGASCIYPIIGSQSYGWHFTGSEIDPFSVKAAQSIINVNPSLKGLVEVKLQRNKKAILKGFLGDGDHFDLTMCNPPFHASLEAALASNQRKRSNLQLGKKGDSHIKNRARNFGGHAGELWCPGGEKAFLNKMIDDSSRYRSNVTWFTSLVSKKEYIFPLERKLNKLGAKSIKVVEMEQGQKISRFIAWSFIR